METGRNQQYQALLCDFGLYDYLKDRERFIKKWTDAFLIQL